MAAKKIEFRKIEPMSAGKVLAAVYAILGLIAGLIVAPVLGGFLAWVPLVLPAVQINLGLIGATAGLSAIVLFPIAGAITGFVTGVVLAFLYNIVADRIGGIEIETK